jgi:molybdate transport system regulatory protein
MSETSTSRKAGLRGLLAPGNGIGPGKAELLEGIRETVSIAAAGRRIGMSYTRAWLLASALNQHFADPRSSKPERAAGQAAVRTLRLLAPRCWTLIATWSS